MPRLDISVGRLIGENSITIGDRAGWMIRAIRPLHLPVGMVVTIFDSPNGSTRQRQATARDCLHVEWPQALFLSQESDGSWGLRTVTIPDSASALQRELSANFEHIDFGNE